MLPHLEILPPPQKALWPHLAEVPGHFILYGGTGLALRLSHRTSIDFDFFTSEDVNPAELMGKLSFLHGGKILQNTNQTLTVAVNPKQLGSVKLSFFGRLKFGRAGEPERTEDNVVTIASLLDLAATKAAVITQRAEAKDFIDMLAISQNGISLSLAIAAAMAIYGEEYNAMMTVKSLAYFGDGDLHQLTPEQKTACCKLSQSVNLGQLPEIKRSSNHLSQPSQNTGPAKPAGGGSGVSI